ncbi:MAG TPA: carboxypeptidase-like regulatory domain-containing protein, partial [Hanamia sp.]|nr:carboxypeptidase-like regulatory domain-containing protein [Hanamia sp.]
MRKIIIKHPILNKRFLIKHSLLLFFIACYLSSFAKESGNENGPSISKNMAIAIHGKVVDDKGVALTGATITEKGTTNTTLTNSKGEFTINVRNQNSILVISYVGYVTREVSPSSSGNDLVVELTSSDASLQTVIVVGYGTQKKVSSTAAISSVKGEELAQAPVANISNALAGRVSGVIVNANGGRPGADNS